VAPEGHEEKSQMPSVSSAKNLSEIYLQHHGRSLAVHKAAAVNDADTPTVPPVRSSTPTSPSSLALPSSLSSPRTEAMHALTRSEVLVQSAEHAAAIAAELLAAALREAQQSIARQQANAEQSIERQPPATTAQLVPISAAAANVARAPAGSSSPRATLLAQAGNLLGRLEAIFPLFLHAVQEASQLRSNDPPTDIESFASGFSLFAGRVRTCADHVELLRQQLSVIAAPAPRESTARSSQWPSDVELVAAAPQTAVALARPPAAVAQSPLLPTAAVPPAEVGLRGSAAVEHRPTADRTLTSQDTQRQMVPLPQLRVADSFPKGAKQTMAPAQSQSATMLQLAGCDRSGPVSPRSPLAVGATERHVQPALQSRSQRTNARSSQPEAHSTPKSAKPDYVDDSDEDVLTLLGQSILSALEDVGGTWV
jgi:hypothetical protein